MYICNRVHDQQGSTLNDIMKDKNQNGQISVAASAAIDYIPSIKDVDFNRDYFFTNLDAFGVDKNNRPSEDEDIIVRKYAKAMKSGKWFWELSPIYVGINSMTIFNGEHRRKAFDLIKDEVHPIVHVRFVNDTEQAKEKREALNAGKHWNSDDYVEALVSAGNSDFVFLKKFCLDEDHPQLHSRNGKPYYNKGAIVLGATYKGFKDAYQSGEWNIAHSDIATAEKRYMEMVRIKKALGYDDAGQDCWIYFGEAWYQFSKNSSYMDRVKRLPEGIESFYSSLKYVDNTNSNKTREWVGRFVEALEKAERHS